MDNGQNAFRRRPVDAVFVLSGSAVAALCAAVAVGPAPAWERALFRALNDLSHRFELATWPIQQLGMALAVPVGTVALARLSRSWRPPAALLATSIVLGWVVANLVREFVRRERPSSLLEGVQLGYDVPEAGPAFPSGHAIVMCALLVALAPYLRMPTVATMAALAAAAMACRIYVGAHMPLDVLGGAGYGVAVGGLANLAAGTNHRSRVELRVRNG